MIPLKGAKTDMLHLFRYFLLFVLVSSIILFFVSLADAYWTPYIILGKSPTFGSIAIVSGLILIAIWPYDRSNPLVPYDIKNKRYPTSRRL